MTLRLTEEQLEVRSLAREFALGEIRPHAQEWDERRELDPDTFAKLGELGFLGMRIPEAFGGLDLDLTTYLLVLEELAWGDAALALAVAIHSGPVTSLILRYGTEEQKARILPAMAAGTCLGAFALTEAGAGSDARALETRATRNEAGWLLEGRKKWVTSGTRAGVFLLFARDGGGEGIHAFLLEPGIPGLRVGKREVTMGLSALDMVELELDGVQVGPGALLGKEGEGFEYAVEALEVGRLGVGAQSVGIGRAALEHARRYARERVQFGRPLSDFQATRFKLAGMATRLAAARALVLWGAEAMEGVRKAGHAGGRESRVLDPEAPSPGALAAMAKARGLDHGRGGAGVWRLWLHAGLSRGEASAGREGHGDL